MRIASLSGELAMADETIVILHRVTGDALFETEIPAALSHLPASVKLGLAVKLALKAKADLRGADLREADLSWTDLSWTDLRGVNLRRADLYRADLSEADLYRANLNGANLNRADLCGAFLYGADLRLVNLREANLSGAYLCRANLRGACLHKADLCVTNLCLADLHGVDLSRVDLSEASLSGAKGLIVAGQPNGWLTFGYREQVTGTLRVKVGCHDKTMAEAREYWSASHPHWSYRQKIPAALDMIEAEAKSQGWIA